MVPFNRPSIGPTNVDEREAFEAFELALRNSYYSSVVGWIIKQGGLLLAEDGRKFVHHMMEELEPVFGSKC